MDECKGARACGTYIEFPNIFPIVDTLSISDQPYVFAGRSAMHRFGLVLRSGGQPKSPVGSACAIAVAAVKVHEGAKITAIFCFIAPAPECEGDGP